MNHALIRFNDFFFSNLQFEIPIYQRGYTWGPVDWTNLWRDIAYKYLNIATLRENETAKIHFMGTTITQSNKQNVGENPVHIIVDGQQRIITIYTLLCAKRDIDLFMSGQSIPETNNLSHLLEPSGINLNPPLRFNVQKEDKKALKAISTGRAFKNDRDISIDYEHKLIKAYQFFLFLIWRGQESLHHALKFNEFEKEFLAPDIPKEGYGEKTLFEYWESLGYKPASSNKIFNLKLLQIATLQYFQVLNILVEDTDEDAAIIFESVNSKTVVLNQFDHLKNSVFARLPKTRNHVYENIWTPIVANIEKSHYGSSSSKKQENQGDQFIYDYLISRGVSKKGINKRRSYTQFMSFLDGEVVGPITRDGYEKDFTNFLKNDFLFAGAHWPAAIAHVTEVAFGPDNTKPISMEACKIINSIVEISAGPPSPLILHLLEGHTRSKLDETRLCDLLKTIESFLVRNCLTGTFMSPFRSLFMGVMAEYSDNYDQGKLEKLLLNDWPSDDEMREGALKNELYKRFGGRPINAIFRGLEEMLAGPGAHPLAFGKAKNQYSIEHVFPKSPPNKLWLNDFEKWNLNEKQKEELEKKKHHLGNLTAVCNHDNKRLSTKSFEKKCELFENSIAKLHLNESIVDNEKWTADEIDARTELLVKVAIKKWHRPTV